MKGKKYPKIEEEDGSGVMMAAEPAVAVDSRPQASSDIVCSDGEAEHVPLGMFGFYTDDPEVLEQRIAEIEADMDEIDAGIEDPEKWIEASDFWAAMRKEHPWLQ